MRLTAQELEQFDELGYVFKPGTFSTAEAAVLRDAAKEVYTMERTEAWIAHRDLTPISMLCDSVLEELTEGAAA